MNEITVFYRKYRPQTVEDLDSEAVRVELTSILKSGKIPHAFLFYGTRGTGKTSSARILAKAINCTDKKGFEPCNKCEACISITNGSNMDVIEVDGASTRGIDEIRDLREKIKLSPTSLKKKVYIIDEVHMLTTEAFNALLKTLEEPPSHAFFVLCTTEVHKIPETIISRCQKVNFKRASITEILRALKRVTAGEKLEVDEDVLLEIAKASDGSFRDGVKVLEQLSISGKKITKDEVLRILGYSGFGDLEKFFDCLFKKDAKGSIDFINEAVTKGVDIKSFNVTILDYLRNLLLVKNGVTIGEDVKNYDFTNEDLLKLVDLFSRAIVDYKTAVIPQLPLEIASVVWCGVKTVVPPKVIEDKVEVSKKKVLEERVEVSDIVMPKVDSKIILDDIKTRWVEILRNVKPHNHSVEAFLRASSPSLWDGRYLTLVVFYKFHKERLEEDRARTLIEKIISDMMAGEVKLKFVLGEGKQAQKKDNVIKAAENIFGGNAE